MDDRSRDRDILLAELRLMTCLSDELDIHDQQRQHPPLQAGMPAPNAVGETSGQAGAVSSRAHSGMRLWRIR